MATTLETFVGSGIRPPGMPFLLTWERNSEERFNSMDAERERVLQDLREMTENCHRQELLVANNSGGYLGSLGQNIMITLGALMLGAGISEVNRQVTSLDSRVDDRGRCVATGRLGPRDNGRLEKEMIIPTVYNIQTIGVGDRGVPNKERIVLRAMDEFNLQNFVVGIGIPASAEQSTILPIPNYIYYFDDIVVPKYSWVVIYTGPGKPRSRNCPRRMNRPIPFTGVSLPFCS